MLQRLQKKWKVNALQLVLIISTFAIGGSLTGYTARKLMSLLPIEQRWLWVLIFILIMTLLWPLAVILVSIPLGQYPFFIKYIRKIGRRVGIVNSRESAVGSQQSSVSSQESIVVSQSSMNAGSDGNHQSKTTHSPLTTHHSPHHSPLTIHRSRLALFASGAGSNAQKIIDHFRNNPAVKIAVIVSNNAGAGVVKIAQNENIPLLIIEKEKFLRGDAYLAKLKEMEIDWVILAGFLWKIPSSLIKAYPERIINIHPALLPKYGGSGMYGHHVHEAVIANKETESGISIHYVDELYDHGPVIFQAKCPVLAEDTASSLAEKVHLLEHEHYAKVVEELVGKLTS
jgi:formyltetrahydrofolate-dependent phosphoribosylglycinamide formyltransferase